MHPGAYLDVLVCMQLQGVHSMVRISLKFNMTIGYADKCSHDAIFQKTSLIYKYNDTCVNFVDYMDFVDYVDRGFRGS